MQYYCNTIWMTKSTVVMWKTTGRYVGFIISRGEDRLVWIGPLLHIISFVPSYHANVAVIVTNRNISNFPYLPSELQFWKSLPSLAFKRSTRCRRVLNLLFDYSWYWDTSVLIPMSDLRNTHYRIPSRATKRSYKSHLLSSKIIENFNKINMYWWVGLPYPL